jgi:hypothetical protein
MSNRSFALAKASPCFELLVVAIMAMATAGVSLAMRDNAQPFEREAQRLRGVVPNCPSPVDSAV